MDIDIGAEIRSELSDLLSRFSDSWSDADKQRAEETARRAVELGAMALQGEDVDVELAHVRAQATTIAQRAQLKGRDAIARVVDSVFDKIVSAIVGAIA